MSGVVILPCDCASEFQDATYGAQRRVHNLLIKTKKLAGCTVCGKTRPHRSKSDEEAEKKAKEKVDAQKGEKLLTPPAPPRSLTASSTTKTPSKKGKR